MNVVAQKNVNGSRARRERERERRASRCEKRARAGEWFLDSERERGLWLLILTDWNALDVRVAVVAVGARAERPMADGRAACILAARFGEVARLEALSVDARLVVWTIVVESAAVDAFLILAHLAQLALIIGRALGWWAFRNYTKQDRQDISSITIWPMHAEEKK